MCVQNVNITRWTVSFLVKTKILLIFFYHPTDGSNGFPLVPYLPPFSPVANNGSPMKGERAIFNRTYVYSILFCNIQLLCLPRVIKGLSINPHTNTIDHKNSYQLMNGEKNHPTHKLPWMDREYFPYRRKKLRRSLEVREKPQNIPVRLCVWIRWEM